MEGQQLSLDRISSLPPTVIETILCLLPIQEAARTSILSRQWRYKWTKIPKVVFFEHTFKVSPYEYPDSNVNLEDLILQCELKDMSRRFKLFYAIYQVLLAHEGPILDFTLSVCPDETCVEIDHILAHLARTNTLEILTLELYPGTLDLDRGYKLPSSFFSLHQLTYLHLIHCDVHHQPTFSGFGRLTSLYLDHANISKIALLHILSKCPLLQNCGLILFEGNILGDDNSNIIELFECFPVIETLQIFDSVIQRFNKGVVPRQLPTSLAHLKYFCLEEIFFGDSYCLPFLGLLMRSSPNLEKLDLRIYSGVADFYSDDSDDEIDVVPPQDYSGIWLKNLKDLKIEHFFNMKCEVEFVKLILAKSPVLMKVRIVLDSEVDRNEDFVILTNLLRCSPHASSLVEIFVENGV